MCYITVYSYHLKICQKKPMPFLAWLMMAARLAVRESFGDPLP